MNIRQLDKTLRSIDWFSKDPIVQQQLAELGTQTLTSARLKYLYDAYKEFNTTTIYDDNPDYKHHVLNSRRMLAIYEYNSVGMP